MAEIKPEGSGHKTIKLTPVGTTPENEGVGTSTVKVGRAAQKPQAPAEDLEKTQAIPLKKLKPLAAKPVDSPFGKKRNNPGAFSEKGGDRNKGHSPFRHFQHPENGC